MYPVEKEGPHVAVWDTKGLRVLDRTGMMIEIAADDRHALVTSYNEGGCIVVELPSGKETTTHAADGLPDLGVSLSPDGKFAAWDSRGIVDVATGKTITEGKAGFGPWIGSSDRVFEHTSRVSPRRYRGDYDFPFGPMVVLDAPSNSVVASLDDDAEVLAQSSDASRVVTSNEVFVVRVRDTTTFAVLAETVGDERAALSADGKFLFVQGNGAIVAHRIADGAELMELAPSKAGERGLSFTASGLYDGGDAALGLLEWREGGIRDGKLVPATVERPGDRRPGLARDFFAGKEVK
jgi:hypothetical protein